MKRLLTILAALLLCSICLSARNRVYADMGGVKSELNNRIDLKSNSFHLNVGVGNVGFKFGARVQHNFNRFVSWDALTFNYVKEFSSMGAHRFYVMTGVRGFTPAFGRKKNLKFYLSMNIGYGAALEKYQINNPYYFKGKSYDFLDYESRTNSSFAWSPELGFHFSKHFSVFANGSFQPGNRHNSFFFGLGFEF